MWASDPLARHALLNLWAGWPILRPDPEASGLGMKGGACHDSLSGRWFSGPFPGASPCLRVSQETPASSWSWSGRPGSAFEWACDPRGLGARPRGPGRACVRCSSRISRRKLAFSRSHTHPVLRAFYTKGPRGGWPPSWRRPSI